jgi:hypothetical protein
MIEISPVPPDERRVAGAGEAEQIGASDAEVATCWRPHRREAQPEPFEMEGGVKPRVTELDGV